MKGESEEHVPKFYGAVVVGERGQIVIPAEARRELAITPGEKLLIMGSFHGDGLMIIKTESVAQILSKFTEQMTVFESMIKESNNTTI
jgi:AbrB family looped-hinge helix DNA binding protein